MSQIEIRPVTSLADRKAFLDLPYRLYKDDPEWVAPLRFERAAQLNPKKNPTFNDLDVQHFLAERDGDIVGRISAIKNNLYLSIYKDKAGHFGYLDAVADPDVIESLLKAAEAWLKEQGLHSMIGPFEATINEEMGVLIDGFDTPPVMMMPYGRADYQSTLEALGFNKAVDVYAYWTDMHDGYPRPRIVTAMQAFLQKDKDTILRPMRKKHFREDVQIAMDIFNDAWSQNWGFIPFTDAQISHMAADMKPLIVRDFFWVVEHKGQPAAFILMLPNLNEAIRGLNGHILPFGWVKLLYRLKIKGLKTARIPLMGVKQEYQGTRLGLAMAASLSEKAFEMGRQRGFTHVEMSWILEDNLSMIKIIEQAKGVPYKTYRMYEKAIV